MNPGAVRSEVISAVKSKLQSRLSDFMDEICDETEVLRIDRLEIDLGNTSLDKLPDEVMKQISEQLTVTNIKSLRNFPDVKPKQSTGERKLDALVDFLKTGTFSWWSPFTDRATINAYFERHVEKETEVNKTWSNAFKKVVVPHKVALRRLVFQMPAIVVQKLIEKWYPNRIKETKEGIKRIKPILEKGFRFKQKELKKIELIVQVIASEKRKTTQLPEKELLSIFMQEFKSVFGERTLHTLFRLAKDKPLAKNKELISYLEQKGITQPVLIVEAFASALVEELAFSESIQMTDKSQQQSSKKTLDKDKPEKADKKVVEGKEKEAPEDKTAEHKPSKKKADVKETESPQEKQPNKKLTPLEEIFAEEEMSKLDSATFQYAGIVIIWPMISPLFEDRGLLENKTFKDEAAQLKGLAFLNYLSCGNEDMEEFDMPLNKVLCGLPVAYPVSSKIKLSDDDKRECGVLLQHLIDNWPILKSTSINGLRDGFIMREGELEEEDENWLLKVEKKSIDLLMDRMPWGFRTIKLPWMSKILIVEW